MSEPGITYTLTQEQLYEIDRAARAYGYEVGCGRNPMELADEISDSNPQRIILPEVFETLSPHNPFLNKNWREAVGDTRP